ncbi:MAG: hypothetical protein V1859_02055 [archaeon]
MADKTIYQKVVLMLLLIALALPIFVNAAYPSGASIVYNMTETKQSEPAGYVNTTGGSFTTMILYGETQNPRWKAYVGNVTGILTLDDASNYTIYNWDLSTITGEVFASTNNTINWPLIRCASQTNINTEEERMNHTTTKADSINSTFKNRVHREFYVGETYFAGSVCRSTATWVNNTAQALTENTLFQEMLLSDTSSMVYATILQNKEQGFNFKDYDFQMIVPEKDLPGNQASRYYFWVELT